VAWILKEVGNYMGPGMKSYILKLLDIEIKPDDVLAAWSGIRPLVRDPSAKDTAALVRNHMINVSPTGLLTISGGKWTTYRAMAQETIDKAIEIFGITCI
jgi:glycerol-3-phosphate dehydrogenase